MSNVTFYKGRGNHSVSSLEDLMEEREEALYQNQLKYQQLQKENQLLKEQLKEANETIEFYGDPMNYSIDDYRGVSGEMIKRCVLYSDMEERNDISQIAGFRAREYKKKWGLS